VKLLTEGVLAEDVALRGMGAQVVTRQSFSFVVQALL
jgi:hypothetical protein